MTPVVSSADIKKVRILYDLIEVHCRGLNGLGVTAESYGSILVPVLLSKLPSDIKLIVSRKIEGDSWQLDKLLEVLKNEITARERCSFMNASATSGSGLTASATPFYPKQKRSFYKKAPASASALVANERDKSSPYCVFCKQSHFSSECKVVTSLQERKNILKKCDECDECGGRHHAAVCDRRFKTLNAEASARSVEEKGEPAAVSGYRGLIIPGKPNEKGIAEENYVYLQTAQVLAYSDERNPIAPRQVRIIFDSASQRSYVAKHVVDALKLHTVRTETLGISTFGNSAEEVKSCRLVELFVQNPETKFGLNLEAFEIPMICRDLTGQNIQWVKEKYPYLADLTFSDESPPGKELKVDILIGCDQMWSFIEDKKIRGEKGEPVAIYTKFGWTISGPVKDMPKANLTSTNFISTQVLRFETNILNDHDSNKILSEQINKIWDLDSIGIGDSTDSVHESFLKNVEFKDGRYSVNLPWKEHHKTLPDNCENCVVRLKSFLRKLRQEPELLTNYDQIIRQQLEAGIIDRVECAEAGNVHYLPHHCVVRKEALPTKLRIVFDRSSRASFKSPSLNECLETGPSLSPTILDILLRFSSDYGFREKKISLTGDIQSAFLNIELNEKDRDVLRFLWVENLEDEIPKS